MLQVVFFSQADLLPEAQDVQVSTARFQRRILRGIEQFEVANELGPPETLDLLVGCQPVKKHLPQTRRCLRVAIIEVTPRTMLDDSFPAGAGR